MKIMGVEIDEMTNWLCYKCKLVFRRPNGVTNYEGKIIYFHCKNPNCSSIEVDPIKKKNKK